MYTASYKRIFLIRKSFKIIIIETLKQTVEVEAAERKTVERIASDRGHNRGYIFNLETTKIELHFEKSEYAALTDEQKADLKSAFLWSRTKSCWVSLAKEPNLWRAKQVAAELGFIEELREGDNVIKLRKAGLHRNVESSFFVTIVRKST